MIMTKKISVLTPCFNEEANLELFSTIDYFIPFFPLTDELGNQFWWVLKIRCQIDNSITVTRK